MKSPLLLAAAIGLLALNGALAQDKPAPTAAAQPFKLGALQLTSLHDADFPIPNDGKTFGVGEGPEAVAAVLKAAGQPTDTIKVSVDALLVNLPGRLVLLDTGLGMPGVSGLMQSLKLAGVTPDQVTDVLITHSHYDHVGGLVGPDHKPAFPNAKVRMSANEWAYMQSQKASKATAAVIAPQVVTFTPGAPIAPGITPIALYGHTPGHTGYEIVSGKDRLLDIGDSAHSFVVSLAKPDWTVQFDSDAAQGKASRRATLTRLAASHELVFSPHFPYPGVGRIVAAGDGFAWQPALR